MNELKLIKAVILAQLLIESLDDLNGSKVFKTALKQQANRFVKIAEPKVVKIYNRIYENNPELTTNLTRIQENIINRLATFDVAEMTLIDNLIDKYQNDKDWFKKNFEAEFIKIDTN